MNNKILNVRIPENEFDALEIYARRHGRTKTEVVREFLRELERKNERLPLSQGVSARAHVSARAKPKNPPAKTKGAARA
jgi:plasmid stability protein